MESKITKPDQGKSNEKIPPRQLVHSVWVVYKSECILNIGEYTETTKGKQFFEEVFEVEHFEIPSGIEEWNLIFKGNKKPL